MSRGAYRTLYKCAGGHVFEDIRYKWPGRLVLICVKCALAGDVDTSLPEGVVDMTSFAYADRVYDSSLLAVYRLGGIKAVQALI